VKYLKFGLSGILLFFSINSSADLFSELSDLKKICDAKLLSDDLCKIQQEKILEKYDGDHEEWFCNYAGETIEPKNFEVSDGKSFSEAASASSIVKEILDEAGLAPNFIVRPASVPNAAASARGGQRYIEYNPSFVSQLKAGAQTNWAVYSVMAHEIGHHLQGHTLQAGGSRPDIELEADEYSGFILAKLGADLSSAQKAMSTFGSNSASGTHPATNERLIAIRKGWEKGKATVTASKTSKTTTNPATNTTSSPVQTTTPSQTLPMPTMKYTDSCVVNGEAVLIASNGAILSKFKGYMQVGQKVPPAHPNCIFDMVSNAGRYCVTNSGSVHFGTPMPVGQCQPCNGNICN
jgi:hypothetical protein